MNPLSLKVIFMGTAEFAVPSLEALVKAGHTICAVVSQPDTPQGRGHRLTASPVKIAAERLGLPVLQPIRVRSKAFQESLRSLEPDVIAVAAYGQIIPQSLLDLPRIAPINVHGSLLPKYRGAAPIQRAIMANEEETGVSTMWMDAGIDTGDILLRESLPIGRDDTAGTLTPRLAILGAKLLLVTIERLANNTLTRTPQDHIIATHAPMLQPEDGRIRWEERAEYISARIRGVNPKPGAYTEFQGKRVKVWMALSTDEQEVNTLPGTLLGFQKSPAGLRISAGEQSVVLLTEVQPENGKRMNAGDWARGIRLIPGNSFSK